LETAVNFLPNKYNTSHHLLKTLLHYRVKHNRFVIMSYQYYYITRGIQKVRRPTQLTTRYTDL